MLVELRSCSSSLGRGLVEELVPRLRFLGTVSSEEKGSSGCGSGEEVCSWKEVEVESSAVSLAA